MPEATVAHEAGTQLSEYGRVLATQNDWRAILFVSIGVIVFLGLLMIYERFAAARRDAKVATALDSIAASLSSLTVEVKLLSREAQRTAARRHSA